MNSHSEEMLERIWKIVHVICYGVLAGYHQRSVKKSRQALIVDIRNGFGIGGSQNVFIVGDLLNGVVIGGVPNKVQEIIQVLNINTKQN